MKGFPTRKMGLLALAEETEAFVDAKGRAIPTEEGALRSAGDTDQGCSGILQNLRFETHLFAKSTFHEPKSGFRGPNSTTQ